MENNIDQWAKETVQTPNVPAVDLPRLVSEDCISVECSECGHVATTTKRAIIVRAQQCGRVWIPRCPECGHSFLANAQGHLPAEGEPTK